MLANVLLTAAAAFTGLVAANPVPVSELEVRDSSNCTTYSSVSAGTVCRQIPSDCSAFYSPQSGENCLGIAQAFNNYSLSIFHYWNPDVGKGCTNLRAYVPYCINTPWYTYEGSIQPASGTVESTDSTPAIDEPFPILSDTTDSCTKYELAGNGITVYSMATDNNVSFDDFYTWNPSTKADNNVVPQYWYCVGTS